MGDKLCPKIILEGTRLTFKTEIAFELNEHPEVVGPRKYRYHSPLVSGEWCAFTPFPWGRGLINFEPQEEKRAMETYRTWAHLFELLYYYSWIIDRFHISTQAFQLQQYQKRYDFGWLEEKLHACGFHLIFMTRSAESFAQAREKRLEVSGNPGQYNDLDIFRREQEILETLIEASILPVLRVDISDNNIDRGVKTIVDWLKSNGGLYVDEQAPGVV
jgi:hypothetical protein